MRSLVDPRLLDRLAPSFFTSRATIQAAVETGREPSGAVITAWTTLAGMHGIACAIAPVSGSERQTSQLTASETTHAVRLQGRFPAITAAHRVVVDGTIYDILEAATDSQGVSTRLSVRKGTPTAEAGV